VRLEFTKKFLGCLLYGLRTLPHQSTFTFMLCLLLDAKMKVSFFVKSVIFCPTFENYLLFTTFPRDFLKVGQFLALLAIFDTFILLYFLAVSFYLLPLYFSLQYLYIILHILIFLPPQQKTIIIIYITNII
jgi:hypothetical protein